jgi:hypothetical protein
VNASSEGKILRENPRVTKQSPEPSDFSSTKPKSNRKSRLVMKPIIPFALLGALFAVGAANAASTDPVGYITHTIAGNVSGDPGGADTFVSPTLVGPAVFASATIVAPSGSLATFSGSVPTDLDSTYILEIVSGADEGWWSKITSSTATTITSADAIPVTAGTNVQMVVRKLPTLNSFLGENLPGLDSSDQVLLLDPATQTVSFVLYVGGEWQNFVTEGNMDNEPILPGTAIAVRRFASTPLTFVSTGEVKTTDTEVDILAQDNWLGQPLAVGGTFATMTFKDQILSSDSLKLLRADQTTDFFISVGTEMQNFVTEANADGEFIAEGAGYVISRPAGEGSTLVIPGQVVNP